MAALVGMGVRVRGDGGARWRRASPHHLDVADGGDRGAVAGADAGRAHDPHLGAELRGRSASSLSAPAMAQDRLSHTRTVITGGGGPSFTTSKWA